MTPGPPRAPGSFLRFCLSVALCVFVGWAGGIITAPQIPVWYELGEASLDIR